ncbi:aspartate kinase [Elizabethkingia anophelis]|uniref:aspartate kinase n=1 Tax=Elizabethkingia anophelis TaxID=1117645 RepID=UPI000999419D|nr:aspartate kinase [Elizabethkingia anophelis]MCT3906719.1 aspartate kinase [Elizabethkingia anophelis]MCT4287234.1 aspartate kinase [Elizabethkingia anophelis]MDV3566548.1 aspartate kinase [Elizabethkingia anophelis]MDV3877958.1 aspartate kinase [Elizabethkingia anophelis]MDV3970745.1 aspartate kinase [Elizabethkingia anophelis]
MKVLKFGGTSVGSPERIEQLLPIIRSQTADKHLVVLSAVSGTTNDLVTLSELYAKKEDKAVQKHIDILYAKYKEFVKELFRTESGTLEALAFIDNVFQLLYNFDSANFTTKEERIILAQGEIISTTLFHLHLKEKGISSVLLSALDFMLIDKEGEPDVEYIRENATTEIAKFPDEKLFITQGYICRNAQGEIDNLRRGGSDYTASLLGAALQVEEIQIWTDIDGFHNNDPRYVPNTKPIAHLNFDEAAELSYFGAKILHPQSVFPARKYNVPVRLLDTMNLSAPGTLISGETKNLNQIVAIAAKDNITAIRIESSRMLMAYGFLRKVFEVFEVHKTPIDMITTSEVAVSLTIDQTEFLPEIIKKLESFGTVDIDNEQSIICIVGDFKKNNHGLATIVSEAVKHIPVRMISYGGSENNISLLVPTSYKIEALRSLHNRLF